MIDSKLNVCCFTGHRKISPEKYDKLIRRLKGEIETCISLGYSSFMTGGALGFDTLAAQTVQSLKTSYPQIRLLLALPCRSQASGWSEKNKLIYESIKADADVVVYTSDNYYKGCMQKRNRYLIDHSSLCICYLLNSAGGTAYTVKYAKQKYVPVVNLAEYHDTVCL